MSNRSKFLFSLGLALAVFLPSEADATYRYLCTSIPAACVYAPPTAPALKSNVCWDGTAAYLMPEIGCQSGSWPYSLEHGEVIDPLTNEVAGYVALNDACSSPGLCVAYEPHSGGQEDAMCCTSVDCYTSLSCGGTIWWCYDGVDDGDGTITCYESEQIG